MSLLWRDQLRIALSPDRVDLVRLKRGLRWRVVEKISEPYPPGESWHATLAALSKLLQKQRGADATVVLSSHFSRYVVVPWSDAVSGQDELDALASHRCVQVYGNLAAGWDVRVSTGKFGVPMLACGMERDFLEALRKACSDAGVRLKSVQPALMSAFNRWRSLVKEPGGWFGIVEAGRLTLALLHQGGWHSVQVRHIEDTLANSLPAMLNQERLLADFPDVPQSVFLFTPEYPNATLPTTGKWMVRSLKLSALNGFSPLKDGAFGLAMSGEA